MGAGQVHLELTLTGQDTYSLTYDSYADPGTVLIGEPGSLLIGAALVAPNSFDVTAVGNGRLKNLSQIRPYR
jgi:hypothetical protein